MIFHVTWTALDHTSIPIFLKVYQESKASGFAGLNLGPDIKVISSYHLDPRMGIAQGFMIVSADSMEIVQAAVHQWKVVYCVVVPVLTDEEIVPILTDPKFQDYRKP